MRFRHRRAAQAWLRASLPVTIMGGLLLYAVWPWLPLHGPATRHRSVVLYGFSILEQSITEAVFPAFQERWKTLTGEHVELTAAFAGSGTVTNQIISGVPADLALLSTELDAVRLAEARVIADSSWRRLPHRGIVNRSPFVILVRAGNPLGIRDFQDLTRPGVRVVHPDPLTSGAANWSIVAEYGAGQRANPGNPRAGHDLLLGVWRNVVAQAPSARAARTQFENGFGDALVTYEQEVIRDRLLGRLEGEIVYPRSTVLSEHVLVVIERNTLTDNRAVVDSLVAFLWSDVAQRRFVEEGFRSVDDSLNSGHPAFGHIEDPFLIDSLGGWQVARRAIIEDVWKRQVLPEIGR